MFTVLQYVKDFCDPGGVRTHAPRIKSALLYLLSYEIIFIFLCTHPDSNRNSRILKVWGFAN